MSLVNSKLPNVELYENAPNNKVKITDLFAGKKGILLGMNGAFTPICSSSHLTSFIKNYDECKSKGFDIIVCVCVNDPYVTKAWSKQSNADNKVRILADPSAEFTKAIGMQINLPQLGGVRSKRYTALIDNNHVKQVFEEPDGTGNTCTSYDDISKNLKL